MNAQVSTASTYTNTSISSAPSYDLIIVGAGQAGLAAAHYAQKAGLRFVVLDGETRIGDNWRKRWASLRLFTPAKYSSLPGMPFPALPLYLPTKDEVGDYLQAYAEQFQLPVHLNTRVRRAWRNGEAWHIEMDQGEYKASQLMVATGTFGTPNVPLFAADLSPSIQQMHSSAYGKPADIAGKRVLVVGAGSSGSQIALDLAPTHTVFLAGRNPGNFPRRLFGRDIYDWFSTFHLMEARSTSWIGRQAQAQQGGDARVGISPADIQRAGIEWLPRVVSVVNGLLQLANGQILTVDAVIWATGYKPAFLWIEQLPVQEDGNPVHTGGVSPMPGLYFMGLQYQRHIGSHLLGYVGRDAAELIPVITERTSQFQ